MEDDKKKQGQGGYGDFLKSHETGSENTEQALADDEKKKQNSENYN